MKPVTQLLSSTQTESKDVTMDLSLDLDEALAAKGLSWQQRLDSITGFYQKSDIFSFLNTTALSAVEAVAAQLHDSGLVPKIAQHDEYVELSVPHGDRGVFRYVVRARSYRSPSFAWADTANTSRDSRHYRAIASGNDEERQRDVTGYTSEQLIDDLLSQYARFRHIRRVS